ncbi:MAG: preprotein translocase subunit SecG [Candidatus Doudnabacteria bacterium]|nr:preprotein translocase subunit SecG [Candidatus Doudnabacteria bacterium]
MNKLQLAITFVNMAVMVGLIITVSLQRKGAGLSTVFGGSGNIAQTRRGFEKWLFFTTIVLGILFVGLSVTSLLLNK